MSGIKKIAVGTAVLSWLFLAGCGTNSRIPEIREASFDRSSTPAAADAFYEVRLGDTLYSIAWRYNTDYHDLAHWNDLQPPYALRAGQKLRLSAPAVASSANGAQVKPLTSGVSMSVPANSEDDSWLVSTPVKAPPNADSPSSAPTGPRDEAGSIANQTPVRTDDYSSSSTNGSRSTTPSTTKESEHPSQTVPTVSPAVEPANAPATSTDNAITPVTHESKVPESQAQTTSSTWLWPTKGAIVGHFSDPSTITAGLDIAGQKGQPVVASRSGTVVYAGNSVRGYGNLVIIKHDDHFLSAYAHNDALKVKTNDTVKAGQMIATMGDSEADRAKLHFEIRQDSQSKDPQQFLPRS